MRSTQEVVMVAVLLGIAALLLYSLTPDEPNREPVRKRRREDR